MQRPDDTVLVHTFGLSDRELSRTLADRLGPADRSLANTSTTDGLVTVELRRLGDAGGDPQQTAGELERVLGPIAFGRGESTLEESLVAVLKKNGQRLVTAESCTGGLVAKKITDIPGASSVYLGGWVVYANTAKTRQLGVPAEMLAQDGAVSQAVARALAAGALRHSDADLSVSITGIAGPGGGTDEKPVGTVWIALAARRQQTIDQIATQTWRCRLSGNRSEIRRAAANYALGLLRLDVLQSPATAVPAAECLGP